MDIYVPEGSGTFPLVILVHGGGFKVGDKANEYNRAMELVKNGFVAATINYRLSGEAKFPSNINDVKAAIRFLKANAPKFNINSQKVGLWGGSSGGNLVSLAGTSGDIEELEDFSMGNPDVSSKVQAVVDWFGPTDFLKMDEYLKMNGVADPGHSSPDSHESQALGAHITQVPDLVAKANPETYITPDDPPFVIQHGKEDRTAPFQLSEIFAAKLKAVIGDDKVTISLLEGAGHGGAQFNTKENLAEVISFFNKYLK